MERNDIKQVVDLPGVGENYSGELQNGSRVFGTWLSILILYTDHPLIILPFLAKEDADTLHGIVHCDRSEHESKFHF